MDNFESYEVVIHVLPDNSLSEINEFHMIDNILEVDQCALKKHCLFSFDEKIVYQRMIYSYENPNRTYKIKWTKLIEH